jgi:DNA-directed RNA polymerase alpha subunit
MAVVVDLELIRSIRNSTALENMRAHGERFHPIYMTGVTDLPLTVRTKNCLSNGAVYFLGDLIQCSEAELLALPNFGAKCLAEVQELLAAWGMHLGMELVGSHAYQEKYGPSYGINDTRELYDFR